jgi:hypothetical protein
LTGDADKEISQEITITPTPENQFKITEIKAEKGDYIRYELTEVKKQEMMNYHLTVYNTRKEKGWYLDKIYLKTDSEKPSELEIKILGYIRDKQKEK